MNSNSSADVTIACDEFSGNSDVGADNVADPFGECTKNQNSECVLLYMSVLLGKRTCLSLLETFVLVSKKW